MIKDALLRTRPRLSNFLHKFGWIAAHTQTTQSELLCLQNHAHGRRVAVEIGTFQGVSAVRIADAIASDGRLFCIDPYSPNDPNLTICRRELARSRVSAKVIFVRSTASAITDEIPSECDFFFVDADHSYDGLGRDWLFARRHIMVGGVVCLHDTAIPTSEPLRHPRSVDYFREVIAVDECFAHVECCHSTNVMLRVQ